MSSIQPFGITLTQNLYIGSNPTFIGGLSSQIGGNYSGLYGCKNHDENNNIP